MPVRKHVTLVANTAQTVTVNGRGPVRVINLGTDIVYLNAAGAAAVVGADDTYVVGPGAVRLIDVADRDGTIALSAVSTGTPAVSVEIAERVGEGY